MVRPAARGRMMPALTETACDARGVEDAAPYRRALSPDFVGSSP